MIYFLVGIFLLITGSITSLFFPENRKGQIVSAFTALATFCLFVSVLPVLSGSRLYPTLGFSHLLTGTVDLTIDPLSAFFVLTISILSMITTIYACGYLKSDQDKGKQTALQFFFLPLLTCSMLLVVTLRNGLAFLFAWELMSMASYFLITYENDNREVFAAGIEYLIFTHLSLIILSIGFVLLANRSGSYSFDTFRFAISTFQHPGLIFILFFCGFSLKAGFIPFHIWLPRAHPAAPSHVSGLMSGVMIKTGIYGIARILTFMDTIPFWLGFLVLAVSTFSAVVGVLFALAQHDLKRLLAYHSVENIGIIGMGMGIGMLGISTGNSTVAFLGFAGAFLHVLNHSLFKALLFFGAGAVYRATHLRDIELLGGLIKSMPFTAAFFLVGSMAISGLPPFNGFVSEFLIYFALLKASLIRLPVLILISVAAISFLSFVGVMAMMCFSKAFSIVFLGLPRSPAASEVRTEADRLMLLPMAALSALCILIGFLPQLALGIVNSAAQQFTGISAKAIPSLAVLNQISLISVALVTVTLVLFSLRRRLLTGHESSFKTWDCGYQKGSIRLQYTASSFVSRFLVLMKPMLNGETDLSPPKGLFPLKASFSSHSHDLFRNFFMNPLHRLYFWLQKNLSWIQSGSTQQYIKYGLIFLLLALLGAVGMMP
ncbi:MAG: proton-conducting transporter membrane subunit [Candidatus Wallbacteria bacterium]|nr:proton-conducting transporter membrane subunit [Candidatus Wallbacteria bacterium]